ncbi:DUF6538 domain-containing protein [Sulfitobacter sp. 1A16808]|uniref:DUF6538 domain-containing protein n=1 Tax=Sulfitobacter sp. 1A16808 TaxID=3368572 RepID=UPI003746550B
MGMTIQNRNGTFYLRRRVPRRYRGVEPREVVLLSLRTDSRKEAGRRYGELWGRLTREWELLLRGGAEDERERLHAAQGLAISRGYDWLFAEDVAKLPLKDIVDRVHDSLGADGKIDAVKGRAFLGAIARPKLLVSECLNTFFELTQDEAAQKSQNQRRVWSNTFKRAVGVFIEVNGDIPAEALEREHMLRMRAHLWGRIKSDEIKRTTANSQLKFFGTVMRRVDKALGFGLDRELLTGWTFQGAVDGERKSFSTDWIVKTLVESDALDGLNAEARAIVRVMVNTGMRPSEVVGLVASDIRLDDPVPHLDISPRFEGDQVRSLKTRNARRVLPLVGVSLHAMQGFPRGFRRYYDKSASLSATVNKYLRDRGLMESEKHTLYGLRHSFEDRLLTEGVDERLRRDFLGHNLGRERYGEGGDLEFRRKQLERVAL